MSATPSHDEAMRVQRFGARVEAGPGGRAVIAVPFDPDQGTLVQSMIGPGS